MVRDREYAEKAHNASPDALGKEKQLERLDRKVRELMGPLTPLILQVEQSRQDPNFMFDIGKWGDLLSKTTCLINQLRSAVTYRRSLLGALSKRNAKAKMTL